MEKIKTYAGFARKMGRVSFGETALADMKSGKAVVVLIDPQAAENTKDRSASAAERTKVPIFWVPDIGEAIGKPNAKTICIKDRGLGNKIIELISGREDDSWQN